MASFFADECVAALIVEGLRDRGFDIVDAKDVCRGEPDEQALALAAASGRIFITDDQGFGELVVRNRQPAVGIIILSLHALSAGVREPYAIERIAELSGQIEGKLAIVEPARVRLRPLSDEGK